MITQSKQSSWKRISQIATWVITGFIALAIAGLLFLSFMPGYGFYVVRSGSMVPVINVGDVVITGPIEDPDNIDPGQIITFAINKERLTHRVISVDNGQMKTQGDANEDPDPFTVSPEQVEGRYIFTIPYVGHIQNIVHSKKGWFMVIIVPTMVLLILIIKDILKEAFKSEKKISPADSATGEIVLEAPGKPAAGKPINNDKSRNLPEISGGFTNEEVLKIIRAQIKNNLKDIY